jgi:hypothetical protein
MTAKPPHTAPGCRATRSTSGASHGSRRKGGRPSGPPGPQAQADMRRPEEGGQTFGSLHLAWLTKLHS